MEKQAPSITLEVNKETLAKMLDFYGPFQEDLPSQYMVLFAHGEGVVVSIYKAGKNGLSKALFQGVNALNEAKIWDNNAKLSVAKAPVKKSLNQGMLQLNRYPQIGSDEVGTGDFFGPIIVVASYLSKDDLKEIDELHITDSKAMDDEYILSIGAKLIHDFDYSELALFPEKYNEVHDALNMNAIKAKMHNRCLSNLLKRHPSSTAYQDQFAEPRLYYSYLKEEKDVVEAINFSTKGETAFPSVALGSVIARYSFLRKMQALNEQYDCHFPLGSGALVDTFAQEFKEKYGLKEFTKVAKINFANYKKLL